MESHSVIHFERKVYTVIQKKMESLYRHGYAGRGTSMKRSADQAAVRQLNVNTEFTHYYWQGFVLVCGNQVIVSYIG